MKPITSHPFTPDLLTSSEYFWNCKTPEELELCATNPDNSYQSLLSIAQNNKRMFRLLATTIPTLNGWSSLEKCCVIAGIITATKPKCCVEIGVYAGRSLFAMALAAREIQGCQVIGIDAYNSQVSAQHESAENAEWWSKLDHSSIERECRSLLKNFQLESTVSLIVKKSDDVIPPSRIDFLHLDGSHSEQASADIERFAPSIPTGGLIVFDDVHWVQGGVLRAIDLAEEMGFAERIQITKNVEGQSNDWALWQRIK